MAAEFSRTDGPYSLRGLNCGLCPMQIRGLAAAALIGAPVTRPAQSLLEVFGKVM